jgi:hypothetical protein
MVKVRLTLIESQHMPLRTPSVEGETEKLPVVGERFVMEAPPLTEGAFKRLISTSPVSAVDEAGFRTENSVYRLELLAALLMLAFVACASPEPLPPPAPPNVAAACSRAIECGAFVEEFRDSCVNCLEHVDEASLDALEAEYGPIPPLDQIECPLIRFVVHDVTNIGQCVLERWQWSSAP